LPPKAYAKLSENLNKQPYITKITIQPAVSSTKNKVIIQFWLLSIKHVNASAVKLSNHSTRKNHWEPYLLFFTIQPTLFDNSKSSRQQWYRVGTFSNLYGSIFIIRRKVKALQKQQVKRTAQGTEIPSSHQEATSQRKLHQGSNVEQEHTWMLVKKALMS
jgi:hypothetical protein